MELSKLVDLISSTCAQGNYAILSSRLVSVIENEIDLQTSCKISDSIKHLKHRYSGLIRSSLPSICEEDTEMPKTPFGIENVINSCYVNVLIQMMMLIDPVRCVYTRTEWRHGTPNLSDGVIDVESLQLFAHDFHSTMSKIIRSILKNDTKSSRFISLLQSLRSIAHPTDSISRYSQENVSEILGRIFGTVDTDDKQLSPHPAFVRAFDSMSVGYMDVYGEFNHVKLVSIAVPHAFREGWSLVDLLNPRDAEVLAYNHDIMMSTPQIHSFTEFGAYLMLSLERGGVDETVSMCNCLLPLDLSIKLLNGSCAKFELVAIVERIHGSVRSGHYYIHTKYLDKWYLINDDNIINEDAGPVLSNMIEILLFKKIN